MTSNPRVQGAALCLAAVVAVYLIIAAIHLVAGSPNSGSGDTSSTSATHATSATKRPTSSHTPAVVVPIDQAQLTQYEGYAEGLQQANLEATKGFTGAGSHTTASQLAAVATPYEAAVNLYDFQLHFIQWPASMQAAIEVDHAQLKALMSVLELATSLSPTGTSTWLSEVHARAKLAEIEDNRVRRDLGLPNLSSFPI